MTQPLVWRFAAKPPEPTGSVPFADHEEWVATDDPAWQARFDALLQGPRPQAVSVDLDIGTQPLQAVMRSVQTLRASGSVALVVEAGDATTLSPMLLERAVSQATLVVLSNASGILNTLAADLCDAGAEAAVAIGSRRSKAWMHTPQVRGLLDTGRDGQAGFSTAAAIHALANGFCHADAVTLALAEGNHLPELHRDCASPVPPFMAAFAALYDPWMGLYPIVDSAEWIERLLAAGARTVQLRCKEGTPAQLSAEVRRSVSAAKAVGAQLFINDHWALALEHAAYGVHLGQDDILAADLDALRLAGIRLGLSSHCAWEVARAQTLKPSYIACGPIHATVTKDMPWWPQGPGNLAYWCKVLSTPVVAIAGMDEARSTEAVRCGASGVAVLRGIVQATDLNETVGRLKSAVDAGRGLERLTPPEWPRSTLRGPIPRPSRDDAAD